MTTEAQPSYEPDVNPEAPAPREPPHSPTTEGAVLSAWSLHDTFGLAWKPEASLFFIPAHRLIAEAMSKLDNQQRDEASIIAQLEVDGTLHRVGGTAFVYRVLQTAPAYGDPWPHVSRLRELAALREMIKLATVAIAEAYEHKNVGAMVTKLQETIRVGSIELGNAPLSVNDMFRAIATDMLTQAPIKTCSTGVAGLDRDTDGFQYEHVAILGAATNWGKSSYAIMLADVLMGKGLRPLLVSFEDAPKLYARRLMARRADIGAAVLRSNRLPPDDDGWRRVLEVAQRAERWPFFLNAIGKTVERAVTDIKCICASEGIDIVIVDYLQRIKCARKQQDRRNEVTYIAYELSDAIKTSKAAGLLLSQFKRQMKVGEKPTMNDLKESGDLENMAEMVLIGFLEKDGTPVLRTDKCKDAKKHQEYRLNWNDLWCGFDGEQTDALPPADYRWSNQ